MAEQRALSQWEIDALLNDLPGEGATQDDQEAAASGRRAERSMGAAIKTYDFRRPDKFSKEQWATLQSMHEHFARLLGASFSSRLRTLVQVRLSTLEQGLYEEWQSQVTSPTVCYVLGLRPLRGSMVVEFSMDIAAEVVDRLLGGNGTLIDRSREAGEVEVGLLRSFSRTFSQALKEMWSSVRPVEPSLLDVGQDASLIQVAAPTDVVLTAFFEISVGNHRGAMSICLPYTVIEPVAHALSAQLWIASGNRHAPTADERMAMEWLIDRSRLELSVRLGGVDLPARSIAGLQEGDTFVLDARLGRPLDVLVGEHTRFRGLPGVVSGHVGIQISDVVEEDRAVAPRRPTLVLDDLEAEEDTDGAAESDADTDETTSAQAPA
ncbi:MAG: flagellar motor switch protein FliM [Dehalococcoidia bacterium]|nr:flagellar motor switch protein FliM [Dehalococcoidia bacterium]